MGLLPFRIGLPDTRRFQLLARETEKKEKNAVNNGERRVWAGARALVRQAKAFGAEIGQRAVGGTEYLAQPYRYGEYVIRPDPLFGSPGVKAKSDTRRRSRKRKRWTPVGNPEALRR